MGLLCGVCVLVVVWREGARKPKELGSYWKTNGIKERGGDGDGFDCPLRDDGERCQWGENIGGRR